MIVAHRQMNQRIITYQACPRSAACKRTCGVHTMATWIKNYVQFYTLCNPLHCTIFTRFSFEQLGTVHTAPAFRTQLHSQNPPVLRPNHANWSTIFVPKHLQAIRIVINNRITTNYITIIIVVDNCQYNKYICKLLLVFACLFFIPKERNLWLRQLPGSSRVQRHHSRGDAHGWANSTLPRVKPGWVQIPRLGSKKGSQRFIADYTVCVKLNK